MKIKEASEGEVRLLTPDRSIGGADECGQFDSRMAALTGEGGVRYIVLDLGAVEQIGAPALRTLVLTARRLRRKKGRLVLCCLTPPLEKVFASSGFDRDVAIVATVQQALRRVRESTIRLPPGRPATPGPDRTAIVADRVSRLVSASAPRAAAWLGALSPEQCAASAPDTLAAHVLDLLSRTSRR